MKSILIWSYDTYVPAHLAMGRLQEEGINSWLKDENTVTLGPMLSSAVGGVKLMVAEPDAQRAWEILKSLHDAHKAARSCPFCGSHDIEFVTSPRKASNWIMSFITSYFGSFAVGVEHVYHCFNCSKEFAEPVSHEGNGENNS